MGHPRLGVPQMGLWHETPTGTVFRFFEVPRKVRDRELWVGPVQLADGRVIVATWGPSTRVRPSWPARFLLRLVRAFRRRPPTLPPTESETVVP